MINISEEKIKGLMGELLAHFYGGGLYLVHPSKIQSAEMLSALSYYNMDNGQLTMDAKQYYDELFENQKDELMRILRLSKKNREKVTYRDVSDRLGYPAESFYLHHFLRKLDESGEITYQETGGSDDDLKYLL